MIIRSFILLLFAFAACDAFAFSKLPKADIEIIQADPFTLLSKFEEGGPPMANYIAAAVITDLSVVDPILSIAEKASPDQAAAIGAGLARAARALGAKNPKAAVMIAEKVSQSKNRRLRITFGAIGPDFRANYAPKMPNKLPFPSLVYKYIGENQPEGKSRLGYEESKKNYFQEVLIGKKELQPEEMEILAQEGPLTAILISDARENGAGSTSPTR